MSQHAREERKRRQSESDPETSEPARRHSSLDAHATEGAARLSGVFALDHAQIEAMQLARRIQAVARVMRDHLADG